MIHFSFFVFTSATDCQKLLSQSPAFIVAPEAKSLPDAYKEDASLKKYREALILDNQNIDALTGASFLSSRIGIRQADINNKLSIFNEPKRYAERARSINSGSAEANFVMAVSVRPTCETSSRTERLKIEIEVKYCAETATKLDAPHSCAQHVFGKWRWQLAHIGWIEKEAANTLLEEIPSGADNAETIKIFDNAVRLRNDYILYYFDLAIALQSSESDSRGIAKEKKALAKKPQSPDEPKIIADCRELLLDLE